MPRKNGKLTAHETVVAQAMAETGNKRFAMHAAGMTKAGVNMALQRPAVQAEIVKEQTRILYQEILPLAVGRLKRILEDDKIRPADHNQAIKIALSHTLGGAGGSDARDPHEMSADELAKALNEAKLRAAALESVKADRAKPVIDGETIEAKPETDLFA